KRVDVATEYAEVCELCADHAAAIETWEEIGEIEPTNPKPYEVIAGIQEKLEFWNKAAAALRTAVTRSDRPRPKLLIKMVDVYLQSKQRTEVLNVYLELIGLVDSDPQSMAFLGATPRQTVENRIRKLGFVWRGNEWIPRERFLEEQGWKRSGGDWLRPKEVRLREVIKRFDEAPVAELRALSDERYKAYANGRRITKGMNRREVIRAWGFFRDHNVALGGDGKAVFEQLLFARSRQVYLKNGLVCFWSE
ncbi:MAG: tetratricopeptide repeat protein, partial [Planctomycetota bacterium]